MDFYLFASPDDVAKLQYRWEIEIFHEDVL